MSENHGSFWTTLPGVLTAVAAFLGSIATLITVLHTVGIIGSAVQQKRDPTYVDPQTHEDPPPEHITSLEPAKTAPPRGFAVPERARQVAAMGVRSDAMEIPSWEAVNAQLGLDGAAKPTAFAEFQLRDNGDGTITDDNTGLTWQKAGTASYVKVYDAPGVIRALNDRRTAGHGDWRLPTLPELLSLVTRDAKSSGKYIDSLFDPVQEICISADIASPTATWGVWFSDGTVGLNDNDAWTHVRAVRRSAAFEPQP